MSALPQLLNYTRPYWRRLACSLLAASLYGIVAALPTYLLKMTIDDVFINRYSYLIIPFILLFIGVFVLKGILMYLSCYSMHWVNNRVAVDIRGDLFSTIIHLPLSFFKKEATGSLMAHFLNDVHMIELAAAAIIRDGVRSLFEAAFLLGFAIYQNALLGLLMMVVCPILGLVIVRLGRARKAASLAIQQSVATISNTLQESFVGIREIKACNKEEGEAVRFKSHLMYCFAIIMRNVHVECLLPVLVEAIAITGCGIIFYVAAHQVLQGIITAGQLTSFVAAVLLSYQPLKKIVAAYSEVQYGLAAAERVFGLMNSMQAVEHKRQLLLPLFKDEIVFSQVSFAYDQASLFNRFNLTIQRGECIGIIGASGSGKSTLCDMLLGFIEPTEGSITIDGYDTTQISPKGLRSQIGYVGQTAFLCNDTIAHNVAYARQGASRDDVMRACRQAHADQFIAALPNGYDTVVGENGVLLSGGQRQRLMIARSLLKDPAILIFDEATSALDQETEQLILSMIVALKGTKTIIMVSHRSSIMQCVDRIVVLEEQGGALEMLYSDVAYFRQSNGSTGSPTSASE